TTVETLLHRNTLKRPRRNVRDDDGSSEPKQNSDRSLEAVDDFLDVKLKLAPLTTFPGSRSGYGASAVREYYKVTVPKGDDAEVSFKVSSFCADSLRNNDGHLQRYDKMTLGDLRAAGDMEVVGGNGKSGQ